MIGIASMPEDGTGLPAELEAGVDARVGPSLDGVRVHRNSDEPERTEAEAVGRGIHLAPGQEMRLPHEAWHVVQQGEEQSVPAVPGRKTPVDDGGALEQAVGRSEAYAASSALARFVAFSTIDGQPWEVGASAAALLDRVRSLSALGIGLTRCTEIMDCGTDADEVLDRGVPVDEARRRYRTVFRGDGCGPGLEPIDLAK